MTIERQTPTELLMKCLTDFGDSEATTAVVIYKQADGSLSWRASRDANQSEIIGMLECVKAVMMSDFVNEPKPNV